MRAGIWQLCLDHLGAGGAQAVGGFFQHRFAFRLRLVPMRRAAQRQARRPVRHRRLLVGDRHHRSAEQRDVVDRARHDPDRVERLGIGVHARRREHIEARLEADDAAIGRGTDHRAAGLRADRQRHHEIGDRRGRAARRSAGRETEIVRVAGRAGMAVGEFGGDGLAEQHAARSARQGGGTGGEAGPAAGIDRRAVAGRHVGGIEDVLDPERYALHQRAAVGPARRGERLVGGDVDPGAHHRLAVADSLEAALDNGLGGEAARLDAADDLGGGQAMRFGIRHGGLSRRWSLYLATASRQAHARSFGYGHAR